MSGRASRRSEASTFVRRVTEHGSVVTSNGQVSVWFRAPVSVLARRIARTGQGLRWLAIAAIPGMLAGPVCASECYSIKEPNRKNYCLAVTTDKPSYCYAIKNPDAKNACLAEVKHKRSYCYSIKATDLRNRCLAETK